MKIGFDAKRAFHNFTGLGNYARTLIGDLSVHQPDNQYVLYTPRYHRQLEEIQNFTSVFQGEIVLPKHSFHRLWRQFGISKVAKSNGLEIFHGLSHELTQGLKKRGIKSVVTMHDIIHRIYPQYYSNTDRKIYDYKSKKACKNADKIIAISHSTKRDVVREYGVDENKVEVIYQSCSPLFRDFFVNYDKDNDFKERYDLPDRYLLYVGSVIERKKLLEIVQASAHQYSETGIPLVVIGSGRKYMRRVYQYVVDNDLGDQILFRSGISNIDLPYVYNGAEMLIYPSEYEGFGIPVIESMYCGTPVISSNMSSLPEVGGDMSYYLDEITSEEIYLKIKKILESSIDSQTRRTRYAEHLKKFDPKIICQQHQELYLSLI